VKRYHFDPEKGLIVLRARLWGPSGDARVRLALDTGATSTIVSTPILVALGYDPVSSQERMRVTTASGVEFAARILAERIGVLGTTRQSFPILCHTLPPSTTVDGLLGLDFLRRQRLIFDFREGLVEVG